MQQRSINKKTNINQNQSILENFSLRIIKEGVNVKAAILIYNEKEETYHLIHYETEILVVGKGNEILKALQCSNSSSKAIYQVAKYLGIDRDEIKRKMVSYHDFHKYERGVRL